MHVPKRAEGDLRAAMASRPAARARTLARPADEGFVVNDIHSQLNPTRVVGVARPDSLEALQAVVRRARALGLKVCVAGGRHAMGGQQFAAGALLVDMSRMDRVLGLDPSRRLVEVEAGIQWPALVEALVRMQRGRARQLGIIQKQTGADRLSVGGSLASNVHGRGLTLGPIIGDVESFVLVDAEGRARSCSRTKNAELFRLAIGGYGLFGIIARVTLRLAPRRKLVRVVRVEEARDVAALFEGRVREGFLYGDFQFMTDAGAEGFMRRGVFSCYRPVHKSTPVPRGRKELSPDDWKRLLYLAHADRKLAFELYSSHYLSTDGQIYFSDTHQLSVYLDDYHEELDARLGSRERGSEMITELYVPRERLAVFMEAVRADFLANRAELIYGTVRLIEKDGESFLAWAKERYACVVFNLHVAHSAAGVEKAAADFRRLIDRALEFGGSYYLTYHRWATREQVLSCYPQMPAFLRLKLKYDAAELFESDWYRHHKAMFRDAI